jgi:uncharacterized protein YpbB
MEKRILTFYAEWLQLPKEQFRILVMLADVGAFRGSLADMCRYFSVDPQTNNNNRLRAAIDELARHNYITVTRTGRTYQMTIISKEQEITMPAEWVLRILRHEYNSEGVAWENVLKVQLWLMQNTKDVVVTNEEIASDIGISISQVVAAMNVLKNEFQAFRKDYAYWSFGNTFRRKGQIIDMSAWWS